MMFLDAVASPAPTPAVIQNITAMIQNTAAAIQNIYNDLLLNMYIVFFLVAENNVILVISAMQSMLMNPNYNRDNVIYVRNA